MYWLLALRIYVLASLIGHLVWEIAQLPLYTIWWSGTAEEIVIAVLHCTAGDLAIASLMLVAALIVCGSGWPQTAARFRNVM